MSKKSKNGDNGNGSVKIEAKNERQQELIDSIFKNQMTVTTGFPGTGKTYIPAALAAQALLKGKISKIILTRPNVPAGEKLGYKPGGLYEKLDEWFTEIYKIMGEHIGFDTLEAEVNFGNIELVPFETMRSRSFNNGFVLLDEAQNVKPHQMKMFVTRIGEAKVVVNGDVMQSDLNHKSGLQTAIEIIRKYNMDIPIIEFDEDDIVRSGLCKEWIVNFLDYERR